MGKSFPAMAVVEISALVEPEAVIEVETIAVIPA
jgi:enamine deaminase RidA (YjgF/YER057c/UK114 family)